MTSSAPVTAADVRDLTDLVARLRRELRRSIRTDYPWEARPMAQIEVLQTLRDTGAIRLGDLANRLHLAQSTVSTLIGRLLRDDLVARGIDPSDRRAAVIELTSLGEQHLREWDDAHQRRLGAALLALPPRERNRIRTALPALAGLVAALNSAGRDNDNADGKAASGGNVAS